MTKNEVEYVRLDEVPVGELVSMRRFGVGYMRVLGRPTEKGFRRKYILVDTGVDVCEPIVMRLLGSQECRILETREDVEDVTTQRRGGKVELIIG